MTNVNTKQKNGRLYKKTNNVASLLYQQLKLKKYLVQIERKTLKKTIRKSLTNKKNKQTIDIMIQEIVDYFIFFTINIYTEGPKEIKCQETMEKEAKRIVDNFIFAYKNSTNHFIPLLQIFPIYHRKEQKDEESWIDNFISSLESVTSQDEFIDLFVNSFKNSFTYFLRDNRKGFNFFLNPMIKSYTEIIINLLFQAIDDIDKYGKKYNIILSDSGKVRTFYNILNLYLHNFIIKGKIKLKEQDRELIYVVSALHPVQDDYIDNGDYDEESIRIISERVKGNKNIYAFDEKIRPIINLIDFIYKVFKIEKHPLLIDIFCSLQEWQLKSREQKEIIIEEDNLLEISFMKGGYAFALFGYIVLGKMSISQFNHFFSMGAIFQLLDDFHDINEDLENKSITIWTNCILENKKLDHVLNGVLAVQKEYEKSTPLIRDFKYPILIRRTELFGVRYDIFRYFLMNDEYFSDFYKYEMNNCFYFSLENIKKYYLSMKEIESVDNFKKILLKVRSF